MTSVQCLNRQFGMEGNLVFASILPATCPPESPHEDADELVVAEISNSLSRATLCLQGAHLMNWQPVEQSVPVIWLSRDARPTIGKSLRGGVPVCWPWFGAHPGETVFPAHGYARSVPWQVIESAVNASGATCLTLRLTESEHTRKLWPHSCALSLSIIVGASLRMELRTENRGATSCTVSEALHAYFRISDIGAVSIDGLNGCAYWDKVGGSTLKKQDGIIRFSDETDRIYIDSVAECVITDESLKRRIRITKSGSLSTVVWTPWVAKAARMGDLGQPDGWREMVCVESANAADNAITLAPGDVHKLEVEYSVESW